jgi:hypothetical protein
MADNGILIDSSLQFIDKDIKGIIN